jgi:serine/threonine-protein kinase
MEKRPAGSKPVAPKKPASSPAAKDADTLVSADNTLDPVNKGDTSALAETEMFSQAPEDTADADAADFLLDKPPPVSKPAGKPKPVPAATAQDSDTVLTADHSVEPVNAGDNPKALAQTEAFTEAPDAEAQPEPAVEAVKPAPAAPKAAAAKPAAAPAKGAEASRGPQKTTTLGDYRLLKKLGAGGMGTVYLAEQISLERQVALKVLSKDLANKPAFVQRFQREARLMAKLDHPNILRCFDVGTVAGHHYLSMEFVDGGSVEGWLKKLGKLPLGDALHVTLACARALQHAHDLNMVHRDIKPDNLLLTSKGVVKLADLGLAKAQDDDLSLTKTGTGAGTPLYMAPEQARDVKRVDGRSDIYSMGVMLYCFLTGELPFKGETFVEVMDAKAKGKFTPARNLNGDIPSRLDLIIDKMVAANPSHRYQTCAEVIKDLEGMGLASPRLSVVGVPAAAPKKLAAAPVPKPPTRAPARAAATRPAEPEAEDDEPEEEEPEKKVVPGWFLSLPMPNGKTLNKEVTREEIITLIKSGTVTADTKVSRSQQGPYRPVASFSELNQLIHTLAVKQKADTRGQKYRELYAQIARQDERRRRYRWLNNLLDRMGGLFTFVMGLIVIVGVFAGGFFLLKWLFGKLD